MKLIALSWWWEGLFRMVGKALNDMQAAAPVRHSTRSEIGIHHIPTRKRESESWRKWDELFKEHMGC